MAGPVAEAPRPERPRGHRGERTPDAADRRTDGRPGLSGSGRPLGWGRGPRRGPATAPEGGSVVQKRAAAPGDVAGPAGAGGGDYEGDYGETNLAVMLVHAEVQLARAAYPDRPLYVVKVDLRDFYPSIPHDVVLSILRRLGLPEAHLAVFARYLAPPLRCGRPGHRRGCGAGCRWATSCRGCWRSCSCDSWSGTSSGGPGCGSSGSWTTSVSSPRTPTRRSRPGRASSRSARPAGCGSTGEVGGPGHRGRAARPAAGRPPPVGNAGAGRARATGTSTRRPSRPTWSRAAPGWRPHLRSFPRCRSITRTSSTC